MKTYMSESQIRLVGRVWEIRRFLKLAQQRMTSDVSLLEYLTKQTGHSNKKQSAHLIHFDGETDGYLTSSNPTPPPLPLQSPQNTPDRRVIPFPSI